MNRGVSTVDELIALSGGPSAIAAASRETRRPVRSRSVHKWRHNGIPWQRWELIRELSGASIEQIYFACCEAISPQKKGLAETGASEM